MKIGILTFHCAHNYGAVLQTFALQEKLKEFGHEVEIIDYRPKYLTSPYSIFPVRRILSQNLTNGIRTLISCIITAKVKLKRRKLFDYFNKTKLNISRGIGSRVPDNYDAYILGSDQIWNFKITNGFDQIFWGDFETKKDAKKITYAASFGNAVPLDNELKIIKKTLSNFSALSLREATFISKLQSITQTQVKKVLDPTLILRREQWEAIVSKPQIDKKYVLVYEVRKSQNTLAVANKIAKQLNAVVVEIPANVRIKDIHNKQSITSPSEFLGWIKNASCIVTTSFHGTAFSIIFNRSFYNIKLDDTADHRSESLLKNLGLQNRLVDANQEILFSEINYTIPNQKHQKLIKESEEFLLSAIG